MTGTVLVTGASGFLGAHVVRVLLAAGRGVVAARHRDTSRLADIETVTLDLTNGDSVAQAIAAVRPFAIIHCAAYGVDHRQQDFTAALAVNVAGTVALIDAARGAGTGRMVHVGTAAEYGGHDGAIAEDAAPRPRGVYGVTKAAATLAALDRAGGLPLAVVRPFAMYGPGEGAHKFVPMVVRACRDGTRLELSPGGQVRDYAYVGDVAAAIADLALGDGFPGGEIINLASGRPVTLKAVGLAARAAAGGGGDLDWGAKPYRDDESMMLVGDVAKAQRLLGWRASATLAEGMRRTVEDP